MLAHPAASSTTDVVIGAFFDVYNTLRFGFLEAVYSNALAHVLRGHGLEVEREVPIAVNFRGVDVGHYRVDLLVCRQVIVEVKATRSLDPSARYQTLNYLRATGMPVGLLLHFGPRAHFHRVVALSGNGTPIGSRSDPRRSR